MSSYDELRGQGVESFVRGTGRDAYWRVLEARLAAYLGADGRVRAEIVEEVACAACGTGESRPVFEKDGFRYVRCLGCGTLYVSPQLRSELVDRYWSESAVASAWLDVLLTPAQLDFDRAKYALALERVEAARGGPGAVLDIGTSVGVFLDVARSRGWDVHGVEPGERARERAASEFGLSVEPTLADIEGRFDLVTFWEVVEHTKHPVELLNAARRLLAPDGILISLVGGNAHAFANRVMRGASAAFDFSRLWYFSPRSFAILVARAGLVQDEYSSLLPELDTALNYLRYDDPYAPVFEEEILPVEVVSALRDAIVAGDLGYKFLSFARASSDA